MKPTILLIAILIPIAMPAWAMQTHCTDQEQIIFSCSLGKKSVSICASADFSAHGGYLQYRFGNPGAIELALPKSTASPLSFQMVQARSLMFAGGGGGYLRFINEPYHYIVYSVIGKGWGAKDGVAVEKNQLKIAYWECQDIPISKFNDAFFTDMGLPIDQREFLIPGID